MNKQFKSLLTTGTIALAVATSSWAQSSAKAHDPFAKNPKEKSSKNLEVGLLIEYFRVDHRTANQLVSKWAPKAADAQGLRDELETMIDEKKATLMETSWVRSRSGQRSKSESIREDFYATEFDPPEIPNSVGGGPIPEKNKKDEGNKAPAKPLTQDLRQNPSAIHITAATPTAFEIRNVGTTMEVDPVIGADGKTIDLNLAPEIVVRLENKFFTKPGREDTAWGVDHINMPTYYTLRDTTSLTTSAGNYNLLGIHTPHDNKEERILVLVRADLIQVD